MKKTNALFLAKRQINQLLFDYQTRSPENTGDRFLEEMAAKMVAFFEDIVGMQPPSLPSDHCQAVMSVYYGGYTLNQWEEDFDKDPKVVEALKRRLEYQSLTPEQRAERREAGLAKIKAMRDESRAQALEFAKTLNALPKKKKRKKK